MAAVGQNGLALAHVSVSLINDIDVVLLAVGNNGHALQWVVGDLANDRCVVMAAVKQNGMALSDVSSKYQNDPEIVLIATMENRSALEYASEQLRNDSFLRDWSRLSWNGHRNRRARQAFLAKYSDRNAKLQARVDLWLIEHNLTNYISAKRQKLTDC